MRPESRLALTVFLCAALIGAAVMLRDAQITGLAAANLPPTYTGSSLTFTSEQNQPLLLNLGELFADPEGQQLTFIATEAPDTRVAVQGSQLTITPDPGFSGERIVTVIASDGTQATTKRLRIDVGDFAPASEQPAQAPAPEPQPAAQPETPAESPPAAPETPSAFSTAAAPAASHGERIDPALEGALAANGTADAIIILNDSAQGQFTAEQDQQQALDDLKARVGSTRASLLAHVAAAGFTTGAGGVDVVRTYDTLNALAVRLTPAGLEQLRNDPLVQQVVLQRTYTVDLSVSMPLIDADDVWNLTVNGTNITGKSEVICIIDTGIDINHTAFTSKVLPGQDYVNEDNSPQDDDGHGTHVSGIAAGNSSAVLGVAKDAKILTAKVCNNTGLCIDADILAGIDFCNNNSATFNISAISGSLGDNSEYNSTTCPTSYDSILATSNALGIIPVFASGNNFFTSGISHPACSPKALSVGSTTKTNAMSGFTNRGGDRLDVLAPGSSIISALLGGGTTTLSGTSMATPHVSGVIALIQQNQRAKGKAIVNITDMRTLLQETGLNVTSWQRVDAYAAIARLNQNYTINITDNSVANGSTRRAKVRFLNTTDLSKFVDCSTIKQEFIGIDANICPQYNKSAHITFTNITGIGVRPLRNGAPCPASICQNFSFGNSSVDFDVTEFSNYSNLNLTNLTGCATVNASSVLTQNIASNDTCIITNASNIVIFCSGFSITYNVNGSGTLSDFGINITRSSNLTVADCIIRNGNLSSTVGNAMSVFFTNYSTINNVTLVDNSSNSALFLMSSNNNTFANSSIFNGSVEFNGVNENNFTGNVISSGGISTASTSRRNLIAFNTITRTNGQGIAYSSGDARIRFNNITVSTTSSFQAVATDPAGPFEITGNRIRVDSSGTGAIALQFEASSGNISNNTFIANGTGATALAVFAAATGTFVGNNATSSGSNSAAIRFAFTVVNSSSFRDTVISSDARFIDLAPDTTTGIVNFTNTTFVMPNGSIRIVGLAQLNGTKNVTVANLNITANRAFLNSSNLTFLNQTAIVTLEGIGFNDPRPQVAFVEGGAFSDCTATANPFCTELGFGAGVFVFNTSHFTSFQSAEADGVNLTGCATINSSAVLTQNVQATGSCILINVSNVAFNCAGFSINGSNGAGIGINATNQLNVTIRNCFVENFSDNIWLLGTNSSVLNNDTARNSTLQSIELSSTNHVLVANTTGQSTGNVGINMTGGSNVTLVNVTGQSTSNIGIDIAAANVTAMHSRGVSVSSIGIQLLSNNAVLQNVTGTSSTSLGLFIDGGLNNLIANSTFVSASAGIELSTSAANNRFVNTTIRGDAIAVQIDFLAASNNFTNTTLFTNSTWATTDATAGGNRFTSTVFPSFNGTIHILGNFTIPISTNISVRRLNATFNRAFLNASNLSFMNTTAIIALRGIAFADPKPRADLADSGAFVDCTATADPFCTELSYSGGVFVYNTSHFTAYSSVENSTNISACAVINASATLTQNLTSNTTCITINASNVILNCAGYGIFFNAQGGDDTSGVVIDRAANVTVRDCVIRDINASGASGTGINVTSSNDTLLVNLTVVLNGTSSNTGINLRLNSSRARIENSTILFNTSADQNVGIRFEAASHNQVLNNTIATNGTTQNFGMFALVESDNNTIANNHITASGSTSENSGILVQGESTVFQNNTIRHNTIASFGTSSNAGITILGGTGSNVSNNNITARGTGGNNEGIIAGRNSIRIADNNIMTAGDSGNNGIRIANDGAHHVIARNTIMSNGTTSSNGIHIGAGFNITFESNNITALGTGSYGVSVDRGNFSLFNNTVLNNPAQWISTAGDTFNNFSNTTFAMPNGSIAIVPRTQANGSQDVTKAKLNITSNRAFMNSANLTFMNTTAIITLRGITFGDPKPTFDFADTGSFTDCTPTANPFCTELGFSGGVFVYNTSHFTTYSSNESGITSCPVTINASAVLAQNLTSNTTCITIGTSNAVLDCAGFTITYGINGSNNAYGVLAESKTNVTIRNCIIRDINASGNFGIAVNFSNVSSSIVVNSTLIANGSSDNYGVFAGDSRHNRIANSTIAVEGDGVGLRNMGVNLITNSSNNTVENSNISTKDGFVSHGIQLSADANNNTIANNIIRVGLSDESDFGIELGGVVGNNITGNTITTDCFTDCHGINLTRARNNRFTRNTITTASDAFGIDIAQGSNNNTFEATNITTNAAVSLAAAISIVDSNNSNFTNTILNDPGSWISTNSNASANFTNTTFMMPNGSINIPGRFLISDAETVDRTKLNITFNRAYLNSTNLTFLNQTGIITLNNISFNDPKPQVAFVDGGAFSDCTPTANPFCTELSSANNAFVFNTSHFTTFQAAESDGFNLTGCAVINASAVLTQNIASNDTCITIGAGNVTLDCRGFSILYDANGSDNEYGVFALGVNNITIKDCVIRDINDTAAGGIGINVTHANRTLVVNTTIITNGTTDGIGVFFDRVNFSTVANSTILTNGTSGHDGVQIRIADNAVITGNNITMLVGSSVRRGIFNSISSNVTASFNRISIAGGTGATGVRFDSNSRSTMTFNNISLTASGASNIGIALGNGASNNVTGNNITMLGALGSPVMGIDITSSATQNTVDFNTIYVNSTTGPINGISVRFATSTDNNFTGNVIRSETTGSQAYGISISDASDRNRFNRTNITTRGTLSYGITIDNVNNTLFETTVLAAGAWMNLSANTFNNFTNTTFLMPNGSIAFASRVQVNGSQDVTLGKLNITFNRAFLNSTNLTFLNASGVVTLNGLTFVDPKPQVDFADSGAFSDCTSAVNPFCTEISFSGGVFTFNTSHFTMYSSAESGAVNLSGCATINVSSRLTQNVTGTGTCITFGNSNISLDCANFTIFYDSGGGSDAHGIDVLNVLSAVIENCTIVDINAAGASGFGIFLSGANSSRIRNVTIQTNGTSNSHGIHARSSNNNLIVNTTIRTLGTSNINYGIFTFRASNNVIRDVTVRTFGTASNFGVYFNSSSNNNTLMNSVILPNGTASANRGVQSDFSNSNNVSGNFIFTNGTGNNHGIGFTAGNDSWVMFNTVDARGTTAAGTSAMRLDSNNRGTQIIGNNLTALSVGTFEGAIEGGAYQFVNVDSNIMRSDSGVTTGGDFSNYTRNLVIANGTTGFIEGIVASFSNIVAHNNVTVVGNGTDNVGISALDTNSSVFNNTIYVNITDGFALRVSGLLGAFPGTPLRMENNTIRAQGVDTEAIFLNNVNFSTIRNTLLDNPDEWMNISASFGTNFTNTTFRAANGSIQYVGLFTTNGTSLISRRNLNITFNRAFLNSTNLTLLNTSAQITLLNIALDDPAPIRRLQDTGAFRACPLAVCAEDSYTGGAFVFNVTQFTTYAAGEGLNVTKSDSPDPILTGGTLGYTVVLSVFSGNASNITLTEQYPPQTAFVSAQPSPLAGTNNTFIIGNLTLGDTVEMNITVQVLNTGNNTVINNTVNVSFRNQTGALRTLNVTEGTTVNAVSCPFTVTSSVTLVQNLSSNGSCLTIGADNVIVDCDGFHLLGNGSGIGVTATGRTNITIRDCIIENFETGIGLSSTVRSAFINDTVISTNFTQVALNGTPPSTSRFDKNQSVNITDNQIVQSNLTVSGVGGSIAQARLSLQINHTFDSDLEINLTAPDGTLVPLSIQEGGSGVNFGNDCIADANRTIFDQFATTPIASGSAPFVGTFRPDGNLSTLDGKSGGAVNGVWVLSVKDVFSGDTGNLSCWSLLLNISGIEFPAVRGFRFQSNANNNTLANNTAIGNLTAAMDFASSQNNSMTNTVLGTANTWLVSNSGANNTFTNTTFDQPNGSVRILPTVVLPAFVNVTLGQLNITFNRAFLNSTAHGFLNTTGEITLRNLVSINPQPIVDFEDDSTFIDCTPTVNPFCTELSYTGGVFTYNASHFSTFSSNETPAVPILNSSNISVTKMDSPDPVNTSANLTYQINVTSNGNGTAYNVTVNDTYPNEVIFLSAQPTPLAGTNNTFILGNLTNGTRVSINITVLVLNISNNTLINNTANISFQNSTGATFTASVTENTTVLNITVTPTPTPAGSSGGSGGAGGFSVRRNEVVQNATAGPCVESWACESWGQCQDGSQSRICVDLAQCGTETLKPAIEQACTAPVLSALPLPPPAPAEREQPISIPSFTPPEGLQPKTIHWTLAAALPLAIDAALIALGLLALAYFVLSGRGGRSRLLVAFDIVAAAVLVLLVAEYISNKAFLPVQYVAFVVLLLLITLLRLAGRLKAKHMQQTAQAPAADMDAAPEEEPAPKKPPKKAQVTITQPPKSVEPDMADIFAALKNSSRLLDKYKKRKV